MLRGVPHIMMLCVGPDIAQVATKAVPQENGTYKISGTKIFISCGDHDMADNILHCVLARQ